MNPELSTLQYRPVEVYDDAVVRAAEEIVDDARAFYPVFHDTFGLLFEAQPREPGQTGPLGIVNRFISYEWNARRFGSDPEIELPADFSEKQLQRLAELTSHECRAYQKENGAILGPAKVLPHEAEIIAFVGAQLLSLNEARALGARALTPEQVSLIQHVVEVVNTSLRLEQPNS